MGTKRKKKPAVDEPFDFGFGPVTCSRCEQMIFISEGGVATEHFHMDSCYGNEMAERLKGLQRQFQRVKGDNARLTNRLRNLLLKVKRK